ncbi:MAG: hypothetical protein GXP41_00680 [Chloroflexi bacterium]|nr:hypothetical protein [Chloroflexota bacterium]
MLTTASDPEGFGINAALSHDGQKIAYAAIPSNVGYKEEAAELWVINLNGKGRHRLAGLVDIGRWVNYPLWSPDDHQIAIIRQVSETPPQASSFPYTQTISIMDIHTGEEIPLVEANIKSPKEEHTQWIYPLDWSPDGRYFFYQQGTNGHVELWRADVFSHSHEYVNTISELGQGAPACYFFSPKGQWLLCSNLIRRKPPQYGVFLVPSGAGQVKTLIRSDSGETGYYNPIWSPDGQEVTVNVPPQANQQAELRSINISTKQSRSFAFSAEGFFIPRSWSPDGRWLAAQKYPKPGGDLYIIDRNGTTIYRIPASGAIDIIGWLSGDLPAQVP